MENLTLKIDSTPGELTIRQGTAVAPLPLKEPNIINVSGSIHAPASFLEGRSGGYGSQAIDKTRALVIVNRDSRTITFKLDPENHYGATVKGSLKTTTELESYCINQEKKFSREQLIKLLKFSRIFFDDKQKHADVLTSLAKLRIKTESELRQENDNRGSKLQSFERNVIDATGFVQYFNLFIPIYKGFDPVKFQVEICFEPSETGVLFWLESPELYEIMQSQLDKILADQLASFEGFVVIYE